MTQESSLSGDIEKDLEHMTHEQVELSCACYPSVVKAWFNFDARS